MLLKAAQSAAAVAVIKCRKAKEHIAHASNIVITAFRFEGNFHFLRDDVVHGSTLGAEKWKFTQIWKHFFKTVNLCYTILY